MELTQEDITPEFINSVSEYFIAQGYTCIICYQEFNIVGLWVPEDHEAFGAPEGKQTGLFYPVCDACIADDTTLDKIDAIFLKCINTVH